MSYWPFPYPERCATYEDAQQFMATGDLRFCVPRYVVVDTPHGKKTKVNPDWEAAPWEQHFVWFPDVLKLEIRSGRPEPSNTTLDTQALGLVVKR